MSAWEKVNHGPINGVRVGRFNKGINTTFVVYAYRDVLVDTGPSNQWPIVAEFIAEHKINHLLLTHHHEDHTGNADNIKQHCNIPVYTNKLCQKMVSRPCKIPAVQKLLWGVAKPVKTELLSERFTSIEGVDFDIILTPGHTDDMSCFHDKENGFLFTGDLYIASKVRYLHKDEDLSEQLNSLNKVLTLDFDTAFCPHRGIMKNGKQDITKKRDYIIDLASQVQDLAYKGMSSKRIQKKLLGREGVLALASNFDFSKKGLIEGCLKLSL
jgi:glyoxylase-like metal-dependent hydrolase (beta-lactamase superfamily II)